MTPVTVAVISPWDDNREFRKLMNDIIDITLVDRVRCFSIYQCLKQVDSLSGDVAEVGVYKGGTGRMMAVVCASRGKTVHLFDTFAGMPECDPVHDDYVKGYLGDTSLDLVRSNLRDCKNVELYPGLFPATSTPVHNTMFSFVHIDTDIYRSTMDCCEFFYPRMISGGILLFDDYGSASGVTKAVDEFFGSKNENPLYFGSGQAFVFKLGKSMA